MTATINAKSESCRPTGRESHGDPPALGGRLSVKEVSHVCPDSVEEGTRDGVAGRVSDRRPAPRVPDDVDRLFTGWPTSVEEFPPERLWNLEVEEAEKEMVVRMAAPGFETEEFHLEIGGNRLFVKAEHTSPGQRR